MVELDWVIRYRRAMHLRSATAQVLKFINHSRTVRRVAAAFGWLPGARYTNLRDVRDVERLGFLDIDWKDYNFTRHLAAARSLRPVLTVAQDVARLEKLSRILDQARELHLHCNQVAIVPKDPRLAEVMEDAIPSEFILAYSVPTNYGGTGIPVSCFRRNVHLLGGRPDVQRALARVMRVVSFDCNRFTVDAAYGKFFDGWCFRRHPVGGYTRCLADSISNIIGFGMTMQADWEPIKITAYRVSDVERRTFLLHMYDQLFNDINRHLTVIWQSVGVVLGAFAVFSLVEKGVLSLDLAAALVVLLSLWLVAHVQDASA